MPRNIFSLTCSTGSFKPALKDCRTLEFYLMILISYAPTVIDAICTIRFEKKTELKSFTIIDIDLPEILPEI